MAEGQNMKQFEFYFKTADLDQDGQISGPEAVAFFRATNLSDKILSEIWTHADQSRTGFLGRAEFYNFLKLATLAQRKQNLTPNIVKAVLYGPGSDKIPAPQINFAFLSTSPPNIRAGTPSQQFTGTAPTTYQNFGIGGLQSFPPQQNQVTGSPRPLPPNNGYHSEQGVASKEFPGGGTMAASPSPPSSSNFSDWIGGGIGGLPVGETSRVPLNGYNASTSQGRLGQASSGLTPSPPSALQVATASTTARPNQVGPMQSAPTQLLTGSQNQQLQSPVEVDQQILLQSSGAFLEGGTSSASGLTNVQWPKMTQAAVQKHNKVFGEVDTDRDGKITGEQARNLILSSKLPLDILKQVWDLSDQDNDGMLTLREFCISRYLMERYMERYPLPSVFPSNIIFEDTQFHSSGQPSVAAYGNASWRHNPGLQQIPGMPGPGPLTSATGGKPSRPVPVPQADEQNMPHSLQKPRLPRLEKHLLDQLSTEEQNSLNSKFKELTEADKKVTELEKGIMDSKEKIEFYRTKMQELILYKSRCDSRLNEIMERVSADKREVETLAKKYEEKYKQTGDAASNLTIEEATFGDIQEKKMELYRAIVKLEQEASGEKIKVHADRIQSDLEVQAKTLIERYKNYRLQAKPTTLVELPFGINFINLS